MQRVKYIEDSLEDSSGHTNTLIAVDSATLHHVGKIMFISVQLNRYKDVDSRLAGKAPSIDRVKAEKMFEADLELSPVEFNNMLVEAVAKKHGLKVITKETELVLVDPAILRKKKLQEKVEAKAKADADIEKKSSEPVSIKDTQNGDFGKGGGFGSEKKPANVE